MSSLRETHPDCIRAIQGYLYKILKPKDKTKEITGMKAVLLDRETKVIVAMVLGMNEILRRDVFLVESIDAKHDRSLTHIKAVCIVRPTNDNFKLLMAHLSSGTPTFLEYHIFFTNVVSQDTLRKLADADRMGVVKQVQEYYADYYAVNPELFSVGLTGSLSLSRPRAAYGLHEDAALKRSVQALLAALLSFKVKPYVRHSGNSEAAALISREVAGTIGGERDLFSFTRQANATLLLVLDRRDDPITPLLTQWTYQAMVHELIGIKNNRVDLHAAKGIQEDLKEVVLSPQDDAFFGRHMHANYGEFVEAVQGLVADYQKAHSIGGNISSIEDMQRFVEQYPELKSKGLAASKHLALMTELDKELNARGLFDLSEVEQNIVSSDNPNEHLRMVQEVLSQPGVRGNQLDALRLVMIYTLRYEKSRPDNVAALRRFAQERLEMKESQQLIDALLLYGGANVRTGDLFGSSGLLSKLTSAVRPRMRDVKSVFTQHQPLLVSLLDQLARNKLSKAQYPFVGPEPPGGKVALVIVFIVGGATFEEAVSVAAINNGSLPLGAGGGGPGAPSIPLSPGSGAPSALSMFAVLGGTTILNSKQFLAELIHMKEGGRVAIDMEGAGAGSAAGAGAGAGTDLR